jgi:hypothetical protein
VKSNYNFTTNRIKNACLTAVKSVNWRCSERNNDLLSLELLTCGVDYRCVITLKNQIKNNKVN